MISVKQIAFFVGSNQHFNVRRIISNHGWMLSNNFDLDLITTSPEAFMPAASEHYSVYGDDFPGNKFGHAASLWTYMFKHSPDIILPVTRPVIYGTLLSPFSLNDNVEYIYRHSGEIFRSYKYLNGWQKSLCYGVRNIGGNIPLSLAERYITLGPAGKRTLINKGINSNRITILPPTISEERFEMENVDIPQLLKSIIKTSCFLLVDVPE